MVDMQFGDLHVQMTLDLLPGWLPFQPESIFKISNVVDAGRCEIFSVYCIKQNNKFTRKIFEFNTDYRRKRKIPF